jgi:hypothetical protein
VVLLDAGFAGWFADFSGLGIALKLLSMKAD